jgi:hypothetical protein
MMGILYPGNQKKKKQELVATSGMEAEYTKKRSDYKGLLKIFQSTEISNSLGRGTNRRNKLRKRNTEKLSMSNSPVTNNFILRQSGSN